MMDNGVLSSWAAEAKASRQLLQCSSLKTSKSSWLGAVVCGGMGMASFFSFGIRGHGIFSGKVPKVTFIGLRSTKASLGFSRYQSRGIERKLLYRGRLDISA